MPGSVPLSETVVVSMLRAAGCVFAEEEAKLLADAAESGSALAAMVRRRMAGYPLEHVLGRVEFCGLQLEIGPGVFVPRRRTRLLARHAIRLSRAGDSVLDLCCGCGALGAAIASTVAGIELYATDIDPAASRCALRNLAPFGGRVFQGDLFDPLPRGLSGHVNVLVSNTPYVPTGHIPLMPPEARLHEPRIALDGGPGGLDVQRRVAAEAPQWLAQGGHVLVEASDAQAPETAKAFAGHGLATEVIRSSRLQATIVVGRLM